MDTTTLKAARAAAKEVARIDAKIRKKLFKRARQHGMTEAEAIEPAVRSGPKRARVARIAIVPGSDLRRRLSLWDRSRLTRGPGPPHRAASPSSAG